MFSLSLVFKLIWKLEALNFTHGKNRFLKASRRYQFQLLSCFLFGIENWILWPPVTKKNLVPKEDFQMITLNTVGTTALFAPCFFVPLPPGHQIVSFHLSFWKSHDGISLAPLTSPSFSSSKNSRNHWCPPTPVADWQLTFGADNWRAVVYRQSAPGRQFGGAY